MDDILRYPNARPHDPDVARWFQLTDPFRMMVQDWFARMRACGPDVTEVFHDGCPVACVGDAPFAYVNAFRAHAAAGFYFGAFLPDPEGLLEGSGKRMRHVKLRAGRALDEAALGALIEAAYRDIKTRV